MNDNMNDYIVNNMILNLNLTIRDHYAIDVTDKPRIRIYIYIYKYIIYEREIGKGRLKIYLY